MYYSHDKKIVPTIHRNCIPLLIVFLSVITFQSSAFARAENSSAEESRLAGYAEQQKGNYESALSLYTKSLKFKPNQPNVLNDMGVVYEGMEEPDKAEAAYLESIKADKRYLPPYMNLAFLYQKQGDLVKAIEYFQKRVDYGRTDDYWTVKAQQELNKIINNLPTVKARIEKERQDRIQAQAAQVAAELEAKAQAELARRLKQSDDHYQKGLKLVAAKKYSEAMEEYEQALALTPRNPKIIRSREDAAAEWNREQIKERYAEALKLLNSGDNASAKKEINKILTLIPDESTQKSK